jgi:hypothetical protein
MILNFDPSSSFKVKEASPVAEGEEEDANDVSEKVEDVAEELSAAVDECFRERVEVEVGSESSPPLSPVSVRVGAALDVLS